MPHQPLELIEKGEGAYFVPSPSPAPPRVRMAFSRRTKKDGSLFHFGAGWESAYQQNRRAMCRAFGLSGERLTVCRQTHTAQVAVVTDAMAGMGLGGPETAIQGCDGMATALTDSPLMVVTADCAPVLMFEESGGAAAAVHAGWRGALGGIVGAAAAALGKAASAPAGSLRAVIGPCIGPCCYEVGPEFKTMADRPVPPELAERDGKLYLDLWKTVERALLSAGLAESAIFSCHLCTACRTDRHFSYRAESPNKGLMGSLIGILEV